MRTIIWLVGKLLYFVSCATVLVFLSLPLSLFGLAAGLAAGPVVVLGVSAAVLLGGPNADTELLTPERVASGALGGRIGPEFVRRDRAWPQYFASQARLDGREMGIRWRTAIRLLWNEPPAWIRRHHLGVWWSLYPLVMAVQVACTGGIVLAGLVVRALLWALIALAWAAGVAAVYVLRVAEGIWQQVVRAEWSCPSCFAVGRIPAYRCLGPHPRPEAFAGHDLHRDLRPGRLGVLWRRCSCGRRLPTTVLRASRSSRLEACCPTCLTTLPKGSGACTDVRIPVFGAMSAGKTQLIMTVLVALQRRTAAGRVRLSWADDRSRHTYGEYATFVERGLPAARTAADAPPVAVTVRLGRAPLPTLVHLFDAAGELLVDRRQNTGLLYLDHARSLLFVLDPFGIPAIRDEFEAGFAEVFEEANPARHDGEDSYHATVVRLRDHGVRTDRKPLAFVVTKADLLEKLPDGPASGTSADVRAWLSARGLDNLVLSAERDFAEVHWFLVSGRSLEPDGALAPVNWLLRKEWVSLA